MTDILELASKAGFIKQDMSLSHEAIEKNVYLVPSDSHLREFASLLREKFIAELGEPVATLNSWAYITWHTAVIDMPIGTNLYALPKDKDELI